MKGKDWDTGAKIGLTVIATEVETGTLVEVYLSALVLLDCIQEDMTTEGKGLDIACKV